MTTATPSEHLVDTTIVVLRMIGAQGCLLTQLRESYPRVISEKRYPIPDLELAEAFLTEHGLVSVTQGFVTRLIEPGDPTIRETLGRARANAATDPDAAVNDLAGFITNEEERRDIVAWTFDAAVNEANLALGAAGEEFVLNLVRAELVAAGDESAAERCERVSLTNDALGYDLFAPRAHADTIRKIEVKTTRLGWDPARIFVTRNEFTTGVRNPEQWSLVIVDASNADAFSLLGHVNATMLAHQVPSDQGAGKWQTMRALLPRLAITEGLPA
jgi:hypothetical protein